MSSSIAFFTEMQFTGKVPRTHENMRVEFAWMCALKADHYNINQLPDTQYDLGIVIIPKKNPQFNIETIKQVCKKVAVMQEGPHWYFQDYPVEQQIWYFNTLVDADIIFTHNVADKTYYKGLTNHNDVRVLPSLMIEDSIRNLPVEDRQGVMVGGNLVHWYGGFDSFVIASELNESIYAPSMGRKIPGEESIGINHLPYMNWVQWIKELNKYKYAVHLMRTHAAGTFALNCAYLAIPCIGYEGLDTQEECHPDLTVKVGDLLQAKKLIRNLKEDKVFYAHCAKIAKQNYLLKYHENKFYTTFQK